MDIRKKIEEKEKELQRLLSEMQQLQAQIQAKRDEAIRTEGAILSLKEIEENKKEQ